jgi:YD repeat-containing protein
LIKANPCDVLSGNKVQREIDYAPANGTLSFTRTYNGLGDHPATFGRPLGRGWFASYLQYLSAPAGLNSATVSAVRPGGEVITFTATIPGSTSTQYTAQGESKDRLTVALNGSGTFIGWRYITANDDKELYNTSGRLLSITSRAGVVQTLTYASSLLASVTDSFDHKLTFQWDTTVWPARLTKVVLPGTGSGQIVFTYAHEQQPDARDLPGYADARVPVRAHGRGSAEPTDGH